MSLITRLPPPPDQNGSKEEPFDQSPKKAFSNPWFVKGKALQIPSFGRQCFGQGGPKVSLPCDFGKYGAQVRGLKARLAAAEARVKCLAWGTH